MKKPGIWFSLEKCEKLLWMSDILSKDAGHHLSISGILVGNGLMSDGNEIPYILNQWPILHVLL